MNLNSPGRKCRRRHRLKGFVLAKLPGKSWNSILKPVVEPEIELGELVPDAPFTYNLRVELKPQVELVNYKGLELEREVFEITDDMVEQALEDLRNRHSYYQEVQEPRKAQEGDLVIMDLKAELEGKILERETGGG